MNPARVYLAGLSGAGKSAVAERLGAWLGWTVVDVDREVERAAGAPVHEIWAKGGEPAFRAAEARAIERAVAAAGGGAVVALGGGALEDPASRARLAAWGEGVWLDADPAILATRVGPGADRPLLAGADPGERLAALLGARRDRYAALPHRVAADGPVEAVAVEVLRRLPWPAAEELAPGVVFGRGVLGDADLAKRALGDGAPDGEGAVVVATDARVWRLHGPALARALAAAGGVAVPAPLPEGEPGKSPAGLCALWSALADADAGRDAPLAALGGGAVGDVAGLAAATWKRGIPLALWPTTVLAQVDAAIGGKNAIDFAGIKNPVGTFWMPRLVAIDPLAPLTLPDREWRAGWAEIVKAGLIGDPGLFDLCERAGEAIRDRRLDAVEPALRRAVRVKAEIVARDPREAGERRALNLGHTLGHALEAAAAGALLHGEAVAIGLAAAARLAETEGIAAPGLAERVEAVLAGLGLPVRPPAGLDPADLGARVRHDKKRAAGATHAVLPAAPGDVVIRRLDDAALDRWIAALTDTAEVA